MKSLTEDIRSQVFPITDGIWLGPFASPERRSVLTSGGVTHILNVGEAPSVLTAADGPFRSVTWQPIIDLERMRDVEAIACINILHEMVCEPDARVYVHCIAGWNRSPTVVWLYLVACGWSPKEARQVIEMRSRDSIPAHSRLIDDALVGVVQQFGMQSFLPHPRPECLTPVD